jgi:hypothetical protein
MPIKSFRGKLAYGATGQTINLSTNTGKTGYRIVKFQVLPQNLNNPSDSNVGIWSVPQTTTSADVDFSSQTLLAMAVIYNETYEVNSVIVFDNVIFNQDIYINHHQQAGSDYVNYYLELEQVSLDLTENTVATLKDIRNLA